MNDRVGSVGRRRGLRGGLFVLGLLLAVGLLLALGEAFLRLSPPRDLYPYLGEASPLAGLYAAAEDFGLRYRDWESFRADNAERLAPYLPFAPAQGDRKVWAFFGNSFVQAPGMLADHARAYVSDRTTFNLGKNELLCVRLAQVKLLLENGLRPERIFVELMPVSTLTLGQQPLDTLRVTCRGALTYALHHPRGPVGWLLDHSRLALAGWVRFSRRQGNPAFDPGTLYARVDEPLLGDLRRLFGNLIRHTRAHDVPVTVLLIPAYHQVTRGAPFGFQDVLGTMLREQGYDVFDPRAAFRRHPNPEGLFLPDMHFNAAGNQLLLAELLRHLGHASQTSPVAQERIP